MRYDAFVSILFSIRLDGESARHIQYIIPIALLAKKRDSWKNRLVRKFRTSLFRQPQIGDEIMNEKASLTRIDPYFYDGNSPIPDAPLPAFPDHEKVLSADDILPFLPHGIDFEHASGMKDFLFHLDWIYAAIGFSGLTEEYARRISRERVLPIAKTLIRFDDEVVSRIMFPEDFMESEELRVFHRAYPERIERPWTDLCAYLDRRFPEFKRNVSAISTFFFLSRGLWSSVVEAASLSLMNHHMREYARRGEFSGIVRFVRCAEAEAISAAISELRS